MAIADEAERINMKRLYVIVLLLLVIGSPAALCDGKVRLQKLPPTARIYVDQVRRTPMDGTLTLSPGKHVVQIEARTRDKLQIARQEVEIKNGTPLILTPELWPVVLPNREVFPEGEPGSEGQPGPIGAPFTAPDPNADNKTLSHPFRAAIRSVLEDISDSFFVLQHDIQRETRWREWRYDPKGVFPIGPPGPSGPMGEEGYPALPGETTLLVMENGRTVLEELEARFKLPELRDQIAALQKRLLDFQKSREASLHIASHLQILTPEWRAYYDKIYNAQAAKYLKEKAEFRGTLCPPGAMGRPGRRGLRGSGYPEGSPTQKVVLPAAKLNAFLEQFVQENKASATWVERLRSNLETIERLFLSKG